MDSDSIIIILVLSLLILLSAYFSSTETAFTSLNRIRIKNMANLGNKKAKLVLKLSEDFDTVLSTILIGNNIVNIAAASLATVFFVKYFKDAGVAVSTVFMTVIVLVFAEISPKSLTKESPEKFSMFSAPILGLFIFLFKPLNFLFKKWKEMLSGIFNISNNNNITEEELLTLVEEAEHDGGIDSGESELIRSAIEFNDLDVSDILTPRVDIVAVNDNADKQEIKRIFAESGYSRLPVYKETVDSITGIINQKDFFNLPDSPLEDIIKPVLYTTPGMKIKRLLKMLQRNKSHFAVVTDEYGGTLGIITLEDIIEELVGDIWDEHDDVINEFEKLAPDQYKILGSASADKMYRLFNINEEPKTSTINNWVINNLGRLPFAGDSFTFKNLLAKVTETDSKKVLEIIVMVLADSGETDDHT